MSFLYISIGSLGGHRSKRNLWGRPVQKLDYLFHFHFFPPNISICCVLFCVVLCSTLFCSILFCSEQVLFDCICFFYFFQYFFSMFCDVKFASELSCCQIGSKPWVRAHNAKRQSKGTICWSSTDVEQALKCKVWRCRCFISMSILSRF